MTTAVNASGDRSITLDTNTKLKDIKDSDSFDKIKQKGEKSNASFVLTSLLKGVFCAGACMTFMTIQRTAFGQPLLTKDLYKVATVCGGKAVLLNLCKEAVQGGLKGLFNYFLPDKPTTSNTNTDTNSQNKQIPFNYKQLAQDTIETALVTGVETIPGAYQDSLTAKNLTLPWLVGLSYAKSIFGNALQTKTYKDTASQPDINHKDVVKRISDAHSYLNFIKDKKPWVEKVKYFADCSPIGLVDSAIDKIFVTKDKNYKTSRIFTKDIYQQNPQDFANNDIQHIFYHNETVDTSKEITIRNLIEKNLFREDIDLNVFNDIAYTGGKLNIDLPAKYAFKEGTKVNQVFIENAPKEEIINEEKDALSDLTQDVTHYTVLGLASLLSTPFANILNNEPLTGVNLAKTFGLRLASNGLWGGSLKLAEKLNDKLLGDWAYTAPKELGEKPKTA